MSKNVDSGRITAYISIKSFLRSESILAHRPAAGKEPPAGSFPPAAAFPPFTGRPRPGPALHPGPRAPLSSFPADPSDPAESPPAVGCPGAFRHSFSPFPAPPPFFSNHSPERGDYAPCRLSQRSVRSHPTAHRGRAAATSSTECCLTNTVDRQIKTVRAVKHQRQERLLKCRLFHSP